MTKFICYITSSFLIDRSQINGEMCQPSTPHGDTIHGLYLILIGDFGMDKNYVLAVFAMRLAEVSRLIGAAHHNGVNISRYEAYSKQKIRVFCLSLPIDLTNHIDVLQVTIDCKMTRIVRQFVLYCSFFQQFVHAC